MAWVVAPPSPPRSGYYLSIALVAVETDLGSTDSLFTGPPHGGPVLFALPPVLLHRVLVATI